MSLVSTNEYLSSRLQCAHADFRSSRKEMVRRKFHAELYAFLEKFSRMSGKEEILAVEECFNTLDNLCSNAEGIGTSFVSLYLMSDIFKIGLSLGWTFLRIAVKGTINFAIRLRCMESIQGIFANSLPMVKFIQTSPQYFKML